MPGREAQQAGDSFIDDMTTGVVYALNTHTTPQALRVIKDNVDTYAKCMWFTGGNMQIQKNEDYTITGRAMVQNESK